MQIHDALGDWSARPGPLYLRLTAAIRAAIDRGDIAPGSLVPPERSLAKRLAISRSTVVAAYSQLREEGLVVSRQGSGTWVRGAPRNATTDTPPDALRMSALRGATTVIDLATAALPAHDHVRYLIATLDDKDTAAALGTPGYLPAGLPALREAVAARLTDQKLPTSPEQVLVTTGDQQALSLLCTCTLHPGDTALVEDPTSPGILDVLHALPVNTIGTRPVVAGQEDLIHAIDRYHSKLVYLLPTLGPQGRILDLAARARLARRLAERPTLVVDDTSQSDLTFDLAPPPLAAFADATNLITVGSLTKLHWGGLRMGWIRGHSPLIANLTRAKIRADLGTPVLDQLLAVRLLRAEEQIRSARLATLRACLTHAETVLPQHLPEFSWKPPAGGLNLWLRLPAGTATAFTEIATRLGVAVVPGALLSPQQAADDHIRLVYARPPNVFDEGIRRLAAAWKHYRRAATATTTSGYPQTPVLT